MPDETQLKRMRHALNLVQRWHDKNHPDANRKQLTQASKSLPVMLRAQGLAVAVATLDKDGKTETLAKDIAHWILDEAPVRPLCKGGKGHLAKRLLTACAMADRGQYRMAQREALALAEYIKLYAEAWEEGG